MNNPRHIEGRSSIDAYRLACEELIAESPQFNMTVSIAEPEAAVASAYTRLDPRRVVSDVKSVYDVANTIFPNRSMDGFASPGEFLSHFANIYRRGQSRTRGAWGTYFQRLVAFGDSCENQLLRVIKALNEWPQKSYKAALLMHTSSPDVDNLRTRGGPCLQYIQIACTPIDTLHLQAIYRSHDYFQKSLGNFLGLTRLLRFLCDATSKEVGTLTCHSLFADISSSKATMRRLLE